MLNSKVVKTLLPFIAMSGLMSGLTGMDVPRNPKPLDDKSPFKDVIAWFIDLNAQEQMKWVKCDPARLKDEPVNSFLNRRHFLRAISYYIKHNPNSKHLKYKSLETEF